jgi:hypothetical protein
MDDKRTDEGRRGFLKLAAAAPVAAAATATGTAAQADAPAQPTEGLADTAEARAYYASARF